MTIQKICFCSDDRCDICFSPTVKNRKITMKNPPINNGKCGKRAWTPGGILCRIHWCPRPTSRHSPSFVGYGTSFQSPKISWSLKKNCDNLHKEYENFEIFVPFYRHLLLFELFQLKLWNNIKNNLALKSHTLIS